jgi:hypothetical protein
MAEIAHLAAAAVLELQVAMALHLALVALVALVSLHQLQELL